MDLLAIWQLYVSRKQKPNILYLECTYAGTWELEQYQNGINLWAGKAYRDAMKMSSVGDWRLMQWTKYDHLKKFTLPPCLLTVLIINEPFEQNQYIANIAHSTITVGGLMNTIQ